MRKIEIKIYKFEELKEEVKKELIECYKNKLVYSNFETLEEDLKDYLREKYNLRGFEVSYDLTKRSNDGVCFYNKNINILNYDILKNNNYNNANAFEKLVLDYYKDEKDFLILLDYLKNDNKIYIERKNVVYSHYNTCDIVYDDDNKTKENNDFIYALSKILKFKVYVPICKYLQEIGYSYYDVSDEQAIEYIEDLEYEFFENGSVYSE